MPLAMSHEDVAGGPVFEQADVDVALVVAAIDAAEMRDLVEHA
jgi:hypothetical protein